MVTPRHLVFVALLLLAVLPAGAQEKPGTGKEKAPRPGELPWKPGEKASDDAPLTLLEVADAAKKRWGPGAAASAQRLAADKELRAAFEDEAKRHELAVVFLSRVAAIESGCDKRTGKNRFGYAGIFQLGRAACEDLKESYEAIDDPEEWRKNVEVGAKYLALTRDRLARELARRKVELRIEPVHVYLAHQQGVHGCANLLEMVVKGTARTTDMTGAQLNNMDGVVKARLTAEGRKAKVLEFYAYWLGAFSAVEAAVKEPPPGERTR
jgi:hypothetical protein